MKYETSFAEVAEIFKAVAKVQDAVKNYKEAEELYRDKDMAFDAEFAKYGYTFYGAPQELHTMFDEKLALMDKRDKAEAAYNRAAKKAIELLGLDERDYNDERILKDFKAGAYWGDAFVYGISRKAILISTYIKVQ